MQVFKLLCKIMLVVSYLYSTFASHVYALIFFCIPKCELYFGGICISRSTPGDHFSVDLSVCSFSCVSVCLSVCLSHINVLACLSGNTHLQNSCSLHSVIVCCEFLGSLFQPSLQLHHQMPTKDPCQVLYIY